MQRKILKYLFPDYNIFLVACKTEKLCLGEDIQAGSRISDDGAQSYQHSINAIELLQLHQWDTWKLTIKPKQRPRKSDQTYFSFYEKTLKKHLYNPGWFDSPMFSPNWASLFYILPEKYLYLIYIY